MDFMNDDELNLEMSRNLFAQLKLNDEEIQESVKNVEEEANRWKNMEIITTEKRLLYILLVDHSGSTSTFINEINDGLRNLVRTTQQHEGADAFDLMVFPFSTNVEELINSPVRDVDVDAIKPLKPEGLTRLDLALKTASEKMDAYKTGLGRTSSPLTIGAPTLSSSAMACQRMSMENIWTKKTAIGLLRYAETPLKTNMQVFLRFLLEKTRTVLHSLSSWLRRALLTKSQAPERKFIRCLNCSASLYE